MKIRLASLGCRLNTGEIEAVARGLAAAGHRIVGEGEAADLAVLNSCSVTATASRKSRAAIRRMRRADPSAAIVVTGCLAELEPAEVAALGADLVVPNQDKDRLIESLEQAGLLSRPEPSAGRLSRLTATGRRTRAFIKIQDGCDNRCTFCVVRIARGPGRSRPVEEILAEIGELVDLGLQEAVLTGVHLGSYGYDLDCSDGLPRLIERLLDETSIARLRLSSLEPWDVTPALLERFSDTRLLPHLHLPLQSGSDTTLRRMARRITSSAFAELVATARQRIPGLAISTDLMVGFPGETEHEHERSLAFARTLAFSRVHVFRYSSRPGTAASRMSGQLPGAVLQRRAREALELAARLEAAFNRGLVGSRCHVLLEEQTSGPGDLRWSGLTPTYVRVLASAPTGLDLENRIVEVEITGVVEGALEGHVMPAVPEATPASRLELPIYQPTRGTDGARDRLHALK